MAQKKVTPTRDLADATFDEFERWINVYDAGAKWYKVGPAGERLPQITHTITKEDRQQFFDHLANRRGEDLREEWAASTSQFSPRRYFAGVYTAKKLDDHIQGDGRYDVSYYTSGTGGYGILYGDIDAHKDHQLPDVPRSVEVLSGIFPAAFSRASDRGHNLYIKCHYGPQPSGLGGVAAFNLLAARLERVLRRVWRAEGLKTGIEIKGTVTTAEKSGKLAKLPFKHWTWEDLEAWQGRPTYTLRELKRLVLRLEQKYPAEAQPPANRNEAETPAPGVKARDRQDDEADRFAANVKHTMEFARRLGQVPDTEEVLDHLRDNGLFTGCWEDNEEHRARRIEYILEKYVAPTFDPARCGGNFPLDAIMSFVDAGRQWAAAKYGSEVLSLHGRRVVRINADVLGIYFGLCRFLWEDSQNRDGGIPYDRLKGIWKELHARGLIPHEWHYVSVYKYCRTFLNSQGIIEIEDGNYGPNKSIIYRKGQNFPGAYKARRGSGSEAEPRKTFCGRPLAFGSGRLLKVHFGQGPVPQKRGQEAILNLSSTDLFTRAPGKGRDPPD